jgi:outer membrane protein assembly factor BamB
MPQLVRNEQHHLTSKTHSFHLTCDDCAGKERWVVQTKQVIYTSPTVAPSGTVIYGASGGGLAMALSVKGDILWTKNMTTFHSTMGAITSDGEHVLLVSGPTQGCGSDKVSKLVINTGEEVWPYKTGPGCGVGNVQSAALTIDASGTAW